MTSDDRIDIHKDLSGSLKSNLDVHLKKIIALFKVIVCNHKIDDLEKMIKLHSYSNCEITHMLNAILDSKVKNIDDKKEKILEFENLHERLHQLQERVLVEYKNNGLVSENTYEDFAVVEFQFIQKLTALVIESENYEKNFDGLTNIFNRKYFFEKVEYDFSKARRTRTDFTIVMADIDHFKQINDKYGHQVGDEVLVEISKLFVEHIRAYDIVARYGGEEFVFFIYSDAKETMTIFKRIEKMLQDQIFEIYNHKIELKCSFGMAQDRDKLSIYELVSLADKALYEAKKLGRNQIVIV
ncbi:protein containing GGDEF domain [Sulfurimonas gotlandica GD1]|jgi:diguanylate cyclase (GGDEF)-like protein|uniref:diguanylate cyclase n=1 Tax=Sulfurimonas gotlandica (strain DSM 19862 / JCM 16533 / GD1) TaxID=929558 RepID=B6BHI3_SULGG|nr:GGDEF domain-containing protein [Sulfurimonas gotlandica]EDZ63748.1 signal transduction protein containing diguanilate cyclase/phosphodiesterase domain [Sulfurimonas gotlandica GD1]EHP29980.1 protein containing GGDEF domain [Sulfurimonas gotlandica GD1]